jgi:hypothetical protein
VRDVVVNNYERRIAQFEVRLNKTRQNSSLLLRSQHPQTKRSVQQGRGSRVSGIERVPPRSDCGFAASGRVDRRRNPIEATEIYQSGLANVGGITAWSMAGTNKEKCD